MKYLKYAIAALGLAAGAAHADGRLDTVMERGKLLCSGHNGSFLGFAEVDDKGNWKGMDIDLCRGLAASLFGSSDGNLEIVPISLAQRWPALQSGDIDVVIKLSGWTQSRDTELNLAFSNPYFVGAFHVMSHADLGAETVADLDGGSKKLVVFAKAWAREGQRSGVIYALAGADEKHDPVFTFRESLI